MVAGCINPYLSTCFSEEISGLPVSFLSSRLWCVLCVCLEFAQISVAELSYQSQSGHLNKALSGHLLGLWLFIVHF